MGIPFLTPRNDRILNWVFPSRGSNKGKSSRNTSISAVIWGGSILILLSSDAFKWIGWLSYFIAYGSAREKLVRFVWRSSMLERPGKLNKTPLIASTCHTWIRTGRTYPKRPFFWARNIISPQNNNNQLGTSLILSQFGKLLIRRCRSVIHCRYIVLFGLSFVRPPNRLVVRSFIVSVI